eukprot:4694892-Pleurochrysis_carterae.AAC.1
MGTPTLDGAAFGVTTNLRFYRPYWARTTGLCIAGCGFICASGKVRADDTLGVPCTIPNAFTACTLDLPTSPTPIGS